MPLSRLGVVVPTFMAGASLQDTITSVRIAEAKSDTKVHIVVVDNHPKKLDVLFSKQADHYISLPGNPGFGAACNAGISYLFQTTDSDFIFLLNPDATVDPDFFVNLELYFESMSTKISWPIMPLISFDFTVLRIKLDSIFKSKNELITIIDLENDFMIFDQRGSGLDSDHIGPKKITRNDCFVLRPDRKLPPEIYFKRNGSVLLETFPLGDQFLVNDQIVQNAGSFIDSPFSAGDRNMGWLTSAASHYLNGPRQAWCGAAVLLPTEYIQSIGGFDETFFLYYEDTEFALRGLKSGIFPELVSTLRVSHKHSKITGQFPILRQREIWKSRMIFTYRTNGLLVTIGYILFKSLRYILMLVLRKTTTKHFLKFFLPEIVFSVIGLLRSLKIRHKHSHLEI
jgi:GT2 family glycosyltransferase